MPDWSNKIPEAPNGRALPIRRTPAGKPMQAIVTSYDLIGCFTHFYKGSTHPCEGDDCSACEDSTPYRWHAYMSAVDFYSNLHFIFECTAIAAEFFTTFRAKYFSLRGCHFKASRWSNRPNGRILIRTEMADLDKMAIPEPPNLERCMAILWGLPIPEVITEHYDPQTKMKVIQPEKKPEVPQ